MNKEFQNFIQTSDTAMEGRKIVDGVDHGDQDFFAQGFRFDAKEESDGLTILVEREVVLAERQAEVFAEQDVQMGLLAYRSLVDLYPSNSHLATWRERIASLQTVKSG
jgi:hypothetical protein